MKKYTVRPGDKVAITIAKQNNRGGKKNAKTRRGALPLRREDDYLGRRRLQQTVRIFDPGRLPSGADISNFIVQPAFPSGTAPTSPIATLADYAARDAFLFALEGATLADKFYEIKQADADLYKLTFFTDDGDETLDSGSQYWTNKGVKLPSGIMNAGNVALYPLYEGRNLRLNLFKLVKFTGETDVVKVTSEYDYDADAIADFKIKGGDRLFLMPEICRFEATTLAFAVTHHVNYDLRLGLREYYAADQTPDVDPTETASAAYADLYAAVDYHVGIEDARAMKVYFDFDLEEYVYEVVPASEALSEFSPTVPPGGSYALTAIILFRGYLAGSLAAIVERGSQTFYLWQN